MVRELELPESFAFRSDFKTNIQYWWNRPKCDTEGCNNKALSLCDKCFNCLSEKEKREFINNITILSKIKDKTKGYNLCGVYFDTCELSNSYFTYVLLVDAFFDHCILNNIQIHFSHLEDTTFDSCHLYKADFFRSNLDQVLFIFSKLQEAYFTTTTFTSVYLHGTDLSGTNFSFSNVERTSFEYSDLRGANLFCAKVGSAGDIIEKKTIYEYEPNVISLGKIALRKHFVLPFGYPTNYSFVKYNMNTRMYLFPLAVLLWFLKSIGSICLLNEVFNLPFPRTRYFKKTTLVGIDASKLTYSDNPIIINDIKYQQFLYVFKNRNKLSRYLLYPLWGLTSLWGQSFFLWLFWLFIIVLSYAIYYLTCNNTAIFIDALSFSMAKFLPFGSSSTNTALSANSYVVLSESILGYIMLASVISFFTNSFIRKN